MLEDILNDRRRRRFAGRAAEIELFRSALASATPAFSVLYVHGPGGIGKTCLLEALHDMAVDTGARVIRLDGRDLSPSPGAVLEALGEDPVDPGAGALGGSDGGRRPVLMFDTYEQLAPLDDWVRSKLLPRLPASAITVIADRDPPSSAWRADPAWGDLLRVISLRNLSPEEACTYLRERGVDRHAHERIVQATYGHPLGLSLLADVLTRGGAMEIDPLAPDLVETLVRRFVEAVPSTRHRRALEVCAVARTTTEALLRHALDRDEVRDEFDWLRGLSFVRAGPDGLYLHELARDVLEADLRWRDPAGYGNVFRRVREYSLRMVRESTGRAQQRAIFDLKFLFRQLRSILSPVEWGSWGEYYPDRARPEDREPILGLVQEWEGPESAAIAERWLDHQPDAFFVVREFDGATRGVLAIVDLAAASAADRRADPGALAAWQFAQRSAPPRPGEALTQCRFVIDREAYQDPSPTLNATPIITLQQQLCAPNLSWDFLALTEPDRWNEYFAAADLPRAEGADFTVGSRRYGLFAHDFRAVSVDEWTALWTERALAQDVTLQPPTRSAAWLVLSHPDFEAAVRQGLRDLGRPDLLARNPLLRARLVGDRTADHEADAATLAGLLREAAATLAQHPRDDKLLRAVDRTYLRPAATQEAAAAVLDLPFSTYRRHLTQGVARIVAWLWERELHGHR